MKKRDLSRKEKERGRGRERCDNQIEKTIDRYKSRNVDR